MRLLEGVDHIRAGVLSPGVNGVNLNPPEAGGRSAFLYAFGMACAESGLTEREIEKAVRVCDLIHTHKYEDRKDAPERYSDIARKAIQRETEVSQPW